MVKVLVVEDEASIRSFIVINLRRAGYDVIEAETGEEALERLRANPDTKVALLDIMLPGIGGSAAAGEEAGLRCGHSGRDAAGHERLLALRDHPPHRPEDRHHHPERQGAGAGQDPRPVHRRG